MLKASAQETGQAIEKDMNALQLSRALPLKKVTGVGYVTEPLWLWSFTSIGGIDTETEALPLGMRSVNPMDACFKLKKNQEKNNKKKKIKKKKKKKKKKK